MDFKMLTSSDHMWNKVRDYAKSCSLGVGGKKYMQRLV